jgi:hypothetical protein
MMPTSVGLVLLAHPSARLGYGRESYGLQLVAEGVQLRFEYVVNFVRLLKQNLYS